jgi:hypothetical protein
MSNPNKPMEIRSEELKKLTTNAEDGNKHITIDTVHQDEAINVLVAYEGEQAWAEKEENQVRRIIDFRLMPVLCITYWLQYYDKAMLSQAVRLCLPQSSSAYLLKSWLSATAWITAPQD